jgi:hypothetical protein
MPILFGSIVLLIAVRQIIYGIRAGLLKKHIQTSRYKTYATGKSAVGWGIAYIVGGSALLIVSFICFFEI